MTTPKIFLTQGEIEQIHSASLQLLERVGVKVEHSDMVERLCANGCWLENGRVRIPPAVVENTLLQQPADGFVLYGRDPSIEINLNNTRTYGGSAGIMANIIDHETGEVRSTNQQDLENCVILLDAMKNISVIGSPTVEPRDLPPNQTILGGFATIFRNTVKPFRGPGPRTAAEAHYIVELGVAVRGSLKALQEKPFFAPYFTPLSPLIYPESLINGLTVIAEAGLPLCIHPDHVVGITSPITLAGTLVQMNAELLAGQVMAYMLKPGIPILRIGVMDIGEMKRGVASRGNPELGMLRIGQVQLAKYYHTPQAVNVVYGTTAKTPDYQAGYEKALNGMVGALAGPDILGGMPGLADNMVTSLETIIMDNDVVGMILRVLKGFEVNEDTLALDVQSAVAEQASNFMVQTHTVKHLRAGELWQPEISQRATLAEWLDLGCPTVVDKAHEAVTQLLAEHRCEPLSEAVDRAVDRVLADAAERLPANPYEELVE